MFRRPELQNITGSFLELSEKIVKNISKNFLLYYFSLKCEVFGKTGNLKVADLNQGTNVEQITSQQWKRYADNPKETFLTRGEDELAFK